MMDTQLSRVNYYVVTSELLPFIPKVMSERPETVVFRGNVTPINIPLGDIFDPDSILFKRHAQENAIEMRHIYGTVELMRINDHGKVYNQVELWSLKHLRWQSNFVLESFQLLVLCSEVSPYSTNTNV
jgi:hypothetical protein